MILSYALEVVSVISLLLFLRRLLVVCPGCFGLACVNYSRLRVQRQWVECRRWSGLSFSEMFVLGDDRLVETASFCYGRALLLSRLLSLLLFAGFDAL